MKVLEFNAKGQRLKLDSDIKPNIGSKGGYLVGSFNLDKEYDDSDIIIVSFGDSKGRNEVALQLDDSRKCPFPDEVTDYFVITVWVTCRTVGGAVFNTNKVKVQQRR